MFNCTGQCGTCQLKANLYHLMLLQPFQLQAFKVLIAQNSAQVCVPTGVGRGDFEKNLEKFRPSGNWQR